MVAKASPWNDRIRLVQHRILESGIFSHWYFLALLEMKKRQVLEL